MNPHYRSPQKINRISLLINDEIIIWSFIRKVMMEYKDCVTLLHLGLVNCQDSSSHCWCTQDQSLELDLLLYQHR